MLNKPSWKSQYTNISELQINLAKGRIAGPYTQSGSLEGSMRPVSQYFTVVVVSFAEKCRLQSHIYGSLVCGTTRVMSQSQTASWSV